LIGILAGLLGVGGGWIKTPLMIVAFSVPANIATGTAMFMIVLTALFGGISHIFHGNVDFGLLVVLGITLPVGAFIGNLLKVKLQNYQIAYAFAISLLVISLLMAISGLSSVLA
jgi:uncharacterized membrane protein YfcA